LGEIEEMSALCLVELERPGQCLEHALGDAVLAGVGCAAMLIGTAWMSRLSVGSAGLSATPDPASTTKSMSRPCPGVCPLCQSSPSGGRGADRRGRRAV